MSDFEHSNNNFDNNGRDINPNNQSQNPKVPEYSFWAEQAPNTSYSNYNPNPNNNTWQQGYYDQNRGYYSGNQRPRDERSKVRNSTGMKVFKFIAKSVGFGLIAGISFLGFQKIYGMINPNASTNNIKNMLHMNSGDNTYEIGFTEISKVNTLNNTTVKDVAKNTLPSIVSINSTTTQTTQWFGQAFDREVEGSGSGIIVGKNEKELLIATNNHVVAGANKINVTFVDGSEAQAEIKGTDAVADLAVVTVDISTIKNETLNAISVAKLGNSDKVEVGEMVIAIGNALGYGQSVTVGYISAKDREVQVSDGYKTKSMILLQTDAAINPGNSGGALLNVNGEVIGINTIKYASSEVEGMGYAIPISRAIPIITELMSREILKEEEQGYLGITGNDVTEDIASYYNMPIGVFVNEVVDGGAAAKAGLLPGDIITGADKLEITSISQLKDYVNSKRVGTEVKITYMRYANGKYEEGHVTVTLGKNPNLK